VAEYEIRFAASAAREFRALPLDIRRRIGIALDGLRQVPRPSGARQLQGHEQLYRIRVGHYRIVYHIDDQAALLRITRVRHRRDAYR
jgi:mRNA interferase RelE/StbE